VIENMPFELITIFYLQIEFPLSQNQDENLNDR